jgi:hypothetical protein
MGPFATREEAAGALELAAKRNQDWQRDDTAAGSDEDE